MSVFGRNSKINTNEALFKRLMGILKKLSNNELPMRLDLEREFKVSAKTIQRDIYQRLRNFPIEKTFKGEYKFVDGFNFNKAVLKEDEMLFISLALSQVKDSSNNFEKTTENIFSKLLVPYYQSFDYENNGQIEVKVKINNKIALDFKLRDILPSQKILKEYEDSSLLVSFYVNNKQEIDTTIKTWIPYMELISPNEYREDFAKELKEYLDIYRRA